MWWYRGRCAVGDRVGEQTREHKEIGWIGPVKTSGDETKIAILWPGFPHRKQDCVNFRLL